MSFFLCVVFFRIISPLIFTVKLSVFNYKCENTLHVTKYDFVVPLPPNQTKYYFVTIAVFFWSKFMLKYMEYSIVVLRRSIFIIQYFEFIARGKSRDVRKQ